MLRNLIAGLRLAFFLPASAKDFRISAANLWFIFFLGAGVGCLIDYESVPHPVEFNRYGIITETFFFALMLFCGFVASVLFFAPEFCLAVPAVLLNALLVPLALDSILTNVIRPEWESNHRIVRHYEILTGLWYFLISWRALLLFTGTKAWRQASVSCFVVLTLFLPGKYFYLAPYWNTKQSNVAREPSLYAEDILQNQDIMLAKQLDAITPRARGKNNYVVMFAGFGGETVFMKEVLAGRAVLEEKYHAKGHSVLLINNQETLETYPLATVANLKAALSALGHRANPQQDMLILYLTSHGMKDGTMKVEMGDDIWLRQLGGATLENLLKESGFKWKVVIVSSCFSGAFIDTLKDDSTLVMTSARKDRASFGCGEELDMTYFGDALFKQALPKTTDFLPAFEIARTYIEKREQEEGITKPSEPQILAGQGILHYLHPEIPVYGPQPEE